MAPNRCVGSCARPHTLGRASREVSESALDKDFLKNSMFLPEQDAIVCTVPKAACSTLREVLRSTLHLRGADEELANAESVHAWFFAHPNNLAQLPRELVLAKLRDPHVKKLALLRSPEARFVSGVLDKAHKILGVKPFHDIGCAGSSRNLAGAFDARCHLGGTSSYSALVRTLLGILQQRVKWGEHHTVEGSSHVNVHFRPQSAMCQLDEVRYDYVGYVDSMSSDLPVMLRALASRDGMLTEEFIRNATTVHVAPHAATVQLAIPPDQCRAFERIYQRDLILLCGHSAPSTSLVAPPPASSSPFAAAATALGALCAVSLALAAACHLLLRFRRATRAGGSAHRRARSTMSTMSSCHECCREVCSRLERVRSNDSMDESGCELAAAPGAAGPASRRAPCAPPARPLLLLPRDPPCSTP